MFLKTQHINPSSLVTDIVKNDYRTADVFRRYGIEYCCGGKWPLEMVCAANDIDINHLIRELEEATRTVQVPNSLPYQDWNIDFLADYIVHVHHQYLKNQLPVIRENLHKFSEEHRKKYTYLPHLEKTFSELFNEMLPHIEQEEEIIFPYIRQINHAFHSKESYASLLVKTMRKPIEQLMSHEHEMVTGSLHEMRKLTSEYNPPESACTSHRVTFSRLRELDNDLTQHVHLENNILFPRVIEMEKILLSLPH